MAPRHIILRVSAPIALVIAMAAPALAQKEWRRSDGPYKGLNCASDETVVPIPDGVKCQRMPKCGPDQVMMPGRDGFQCAAKPSTHDEARMAPTSASRPQRYIPHEWNFAYAEVPMVDGQGHRVTDPGTRQGSDGVCIVWRVGWDTERQYQQFEADQVMRWYTGLGYVVNPWQGTVTIDNFSAPMVQDTAQGRRRVGPDETTATKTTAALATTPPAGCTEKWVSVWRRQNGAVVPPYVAAGASGTVPALRANVQTLRFFTGNQSYVPPPEKRNYDELFFYNAADFIYWELTLEHPEGRTTPFTIEEVWHDPGGREFRAEHKHALAPGRATQITWGARMPVTKSVTIDNPLYTSCRDARRRAIEESRPAIDCDPTTSVTIAFWPEGLYQVDLYIDKQYVAAGHFRMAEKNKIYGEVSDKMRNGAAPTNAVAPLGAKVDRVRFFNPARKYGTQFPRDSASVGWEVDLDHKAPGRWVPLVFEALLYLNQNGKDHLIQRRVLGSGVGPAVDDSKHADSFSWTNDYYYDRTGATTKSPRAWLPGRYRLDVFLGDEKIASGGFGID